MRGEQEVVEVGDLSEVNGLAWWGWGAETVG